MDAPDEGTRTIDMEETIININLKSFLKLKKKKDCKYSQNNSTMFQF